MDYKLLCGDAVAQLATLPDKSIQTCITSPPYYGLRDYGTGKWVGGDPNCPHYRTSKASDKTATGHKAMMESGHPVGDAIYKEVCPLCGAIRVDDQIGLEETPQDYIDRLVKVFREVKRVLKDDGTLWVNIGDSYNSGPTGSIKSEKQSTNAGSFANMHTKSLVADCKPKDLIGIPWMLAFALRNDGWYLRQDIIFNKRNPMPESVKDRCVKSHEYIFLLSKNSQYYFDYKAIQEEAVTDEHRPHGVVRDRLFNYDSKRNNNPEAYNPKGIKFGGNKYGDSKDPHFQIYSGNEYIPNGLRSKRDVWTVSVSNYSGAHFATYPEELIEPCVLAGSKEGDTVLDPFSGSGTTGVVALRYNRNYIGIDLNSEYNDIALDRLRNIHKSMWWAELPKDSE